MTTTKTTSVIQTKPYGIGYLAPLLLLALTSCTDLFFFPDQNLVLTPKALSIKAEDVELIHENGTKLHGWKLLTESEEKGTILFFHGNAQNISTHIGNVYWLPSAGYNVVITDYQGFGISEGSASVRNSLEDIKLVIRNFKDQKRPLIIYGQSIGASLAITALSELKNEVPVDAVVLESPFASYQQIAREKLGLLWLTWPIQYPLSLFISDRYAPDRAILSLPKVPLLFIHSRADLTVAYHHSEDLFKLASEPKQFWSLEDSEHIGAFKNEEAQKKLLRYLDSIQSTKK